MRISKVSLHNYRIYKGTNEIVFEEDSQKNIHIVSGFNGFGKTTFLTSLVWCLYGAQMQEVDDSFKRRILDAGGYPKYLEDSLNRNASFEFNSSYFVEIHFSQPDIPGVMAQQIVVKRSFTSGNKGDVIEIFLDGKVNELVHEVGYDLFIQDFILPKEIAKFFFFDAERITELADVQNIDQKRQLAKAYSEVLGIKKYVDLRANLQEQRLKYRRESAKLEDLNFLNNLNKVVENLHSDLEQQVALLETYEEDIQSTEEQINDLQERLIRAGNVMSMKEYNALVLKRKGLSQRADELNNTFKKNLDLAPFAIAGQLFFKFCRTAAEEESHVESIKVDHYLDIIEKIKNDFSKVDNSISKNDLGLLLDQLFDAHNQSITSKNSIEKTLKIGLSPSLFPLIKHIEHSLLNKYREEIKWVTREMKRNKYELNEVSRILSRSESKGDDVIVERYRENLTTKQNDLNSLFLKTGQIRERISVLTNEYNNKKRISEEQQKKVNLRKDLIEKDEVAKRLIGELDEFIQSIQKQKKQTLRTKINESLQKLMHKASFISDVSIQIENDIIDIELLDENGKIINKDGLSMGEKQLYATAIFQALVSESNIDFPVFIDSPMQKLDATHADNIIQHFYPYVSKQVVLLPLMNKEMSEDEFMILEPKIISSHLIYHKVDEGASTFIEVPNKELFKTINDLYFNQHV